MEEVPEQVAAAVVVVVVVVVVRRKEGAVSCKHVNYYDMYKQVSIS